MRLDWKRFEKGVSVIEKDQKCYELIIDEGAELAAPKGKYLTLIVNDVVRTIRPGHYMGDIRLVVKDLYDLPPQGMNTLTMHSVVQPSSLSLSKTISYRIETL